MEFVTLLVQKVILQPPAFRPRSTRIRDGMSPGGEVCCAVPSVSSLVRMFGGQACS
ncbi:hypothetical protein KCP77_10535 [Salmonella enterica subsp. enterica]|nr:hypothetical protein KCP77_10535 [Salmonella enterica subsp. enterica]